MPIQTIDHYLVAPRSQEASQVKQQDTAKIPQEQGNLLIQAGKQEERQATRTTKTTESENYQERYDAKEKGKGSYERQEGKRREQEEKDRKLQQSAGLGGSMFDIKI